MQVLVIWYGTIYPKLNVWNEICFWWYFHSKYRRSLYIYQNAADFYYRHRRTQTTDLVNKSNTKGRNGLNASDKALKLIDNKHNTSLFCRILSLDIFCMCVCFVSFVFFISLAKLYVIHLNWSMTRYLSFEMHYWARIKCEHPSNGCNVVIVGEALLKWSPRIGFRHV